jgi:hypothetical protein
MRGRYSDGKYGISLRSMRIYPHLVRNDSKPDLLTEILKTK